METALLIFGAGVGISVVSLGVDIALSLVGKEETKHLFDMVSHTAMACLIMYGVVFGVSSIATAFMPAGPDPFGIAAQVLHNSFDKLLGVFGL